MQDILRETWAYQEILQEGREEERRQNLERLRQALLEIVQIRFPKLVRVTKGLATITDDPEVLQRLIVKMGTAQTLEEAQQHLLEIDGNEKKG